MSSQQRAAGVFNEADTVLMREAYDLALSALRLTHRIDDSLKTILADCIVRTLMADNTSGRDRHENIFDLAALGVDRLLTSYNPLLTAGTMTLH